MPDKDREPYTGTPEHTLNHYFKTPGEELDDAERERRKETIKDTNPDKDIVS